jgi:hypothetical protein
VWPTQQKPVEHGTSQAPGVREIGRCGSALECQYGQAELSEVPQFARPTAAHNDWLGRRETGCAQAAERSMGCGN